MKKYLRILLLISIIISNTFFVRAQDNWAVYNTANTKGGLPSNIILCITRDKTNGIWVGTDKGLALFNGTSWKSYDTVSTSKGLPADYIWSILSTDTGIWVGTNKGIVFFNGSSWNNKYTESNSALPENNITDMAMDKNGNLWVTTEYGFAKFVSANSKWTAYTSPYPGTTDCRSIFIDSNDTKWIGTSGGGLIKFDGVNYSLVKQPEIPDNSVYDIVSDKSGQMWLATQLNGVGKFNGTTATTYNSSNTKLPNNRVNKISIDSYNNKWITTYAGLVKFGSTDTLVFTQANTDSGLPADLVYTVFADTISGKIWAGTPEGIGVYSPAIITATKESSFKDIDITVYPNPFYEKTTMKVSSGSSLPVKVILTNIAGIELSSSQIFLSNQEILFGNNLDRGIYFAKIFYDDKIKIIKLIKNY